MRLIEVRSFEAPSTLINISPTFSRFSVSSRDAFLRHHHHDRFRKAWKKIVLESESFKVLQTLLHVFTKQFVFAYDFGNGDLRTMLLTQRGVGLILLGSGTNQTLISTQSDGNLSWSDRNTQLWSRVGDMTADLMCCKNRKEFTNCVFATTPREMVINFFHQTGPGASASRACVEKRADGANPTPPYPTS